MTVREQLTPLAIKHGTPIVQLIEAWTERAAIREYLGGLPRAEAERVAVADACDVLGLEEA